MLTEGNIEISVQMQNIIFNDFPDNIVALHANKIGFFIFQIYFDDHLKFLTVMCITFIANIFHTIYYQFVLK